MNLRPKDKRERFIEYLNFLTYHEHKLLQPINVILNEFTVKTSINIPKSTAYRIINDFKQKVPSRSLQDKQP